MARGWKLCGWRRPQMSYTSPEKWKLISPCGFMSKQPPTSTWNSSSLCVCVWVFACHQEYTWKMSGSICHLWCRPPAERSQRTSDLCQVPCQTGHRCLHTCTQLFPTASTVQPTDRESWRKGWTWKESGGELVQRHCHDFGREAEGVFYTCRGNKGRNSSLVQT